MWSSLSRPRCRAGAIAAGVLATTALVAGCGSSSSTTSTSTPAPAASTAAGTAAADTTAAASSGATSVESLADLYAGSGNQPPTSGPLAAKDKSVWWISCGQAIPDCSVAANAAKAAAGVAGFDFKIADAQLNANNGNDRAFREALAAKPDAIIVSGIACNTITAALNQAKQQNVPVMGVEALDCSDPPLNGPKLFTAPMSYSTAATNTVEYFQAWGRASGAYVVDTLGSKGGSIIASHGTEPNHEILNGAFDEMVKTCSSCKIVAEPSFSNPDLTPDGPYIQRLQAALAQHPDANVSFLPFGVNMLLGGAKDSKKTNPDMLVSGGSGYGAEIDLIRAGQVDAVTAHDPEWLGWAAIDNTNRLFNGQPAAPQGIGFVIVDKDHNMPPAGQPYQSKVDYKAAYTNIWTGK
jgi:ribose transport system substrate-binding protein